MIAFGRASVLYVLLLSSSAAMGKEIFDCDDVIAAARKGNTELLRKELMSASEATLAQFITGNKKVSATCFDSRGYNALHHASRKGALSKFFVESSSSASYANNESAFKYSNGETPSPAWRKPKRRPKK